MPRPPRNGNVFFERNLWTDQSDFERRCVVRVTDEAVRQSVGVLVHRTADRHTSRLKTPAPEVLNRREQSGRTIDSVGM